MDNEETEDRLRWETITPDGERGRKGRNAQDRLRLVLEFQLDQAAPPATAERVIAF